MAQIFTDIKMVKKSKVHVKSVLIRVLLDKGNNCGY
jgi:hypothetical protein